MRDKVHTIKDGRLFCGGGGGGGGCVTHRKTAAKEATIPAESFGTLTFLTSHQCIMLFYIPLPPSTMLPLGEKTSFFFNIVMGVQGGYSGNECFVYKYGWVK